MTGQIRNLGIANLAGYTNLSLNQQNLIRKAYLGFPSEIEYTIFMHDLASMNLGIDNKLYESVLLKPQFYYFFIRSNPDFDNEDVKNFVILQFCKYLILLFQKSLGKFANRAMEFDIWELEKQLHKGQIGSVKSQ